MPPRAQLTFIVTPEVTIYNCYLSGNKDLQDLEQILDEVARSIRGNLENAIVVGDCNAKWGLETWDTRGHLVEEWIAENDLVVINEGNKPTFQRRNYSSILDLTLATTNIRNKITTWEVSDYESLSDHKYIVFEVLETISPQQQRVYWNEGWQIRKLDRHKLQQSPSPEY